MIKLQVLKLGSDVSELMYNETTTAATLKRGGRERGLIWHLERGDASPAGNSSIIQKERRFLTPAGSWPRKNMDQLAAFEIIPERPELLQVNEKYLKWVNFTVKHYGRHIPYMMNVEVETRVTFSNDLMIECILYELLSNTYRPTMVQIRMKVCNFLKNEPYVGRMFTQKMNVSCPLTPKVYRFNNMTLLQFENFPYKLPLTWASEVTKARVDVSEIFALNVVNTKARICFYENRGHEKRVANGGYPESDYDRSRRAARFASFKPVGESAK
ncbi:hypothetical protein EVAR_59865_1 [Eumeta japonica]|uniref:Uncharacterized protein n=1 Tax=Eumeta variegata TaxID=151549 RepID=A0A4C1XRB0_EUMVA|nr:hypothetical protein EVAR_59865_1 [Eumeta japonica]